MKLTQAAAQYHHNVEHKSFAEIGKLYGMTRQAVYGIYHYRYIKPEDKKRPGPKGGMKS